MVHHTRRLFSGFTAVASWPSCATRFFLSVLVAIALCACDSGGRSPGTVNSPTPTTTPTPTPTPGPGTSVVVDLPPGQTVTITAATLYRVPSGNYRLTFNVLSGTVRVELRAVSGSFDETFGFSTVSRVFAGPAEINVSASSGFRVTLTATPI